ncbi:MAG TPA: hypothetical protein VLK58_09685, partial [Conexibacter sp.]|nr:hypothetical protein [Conexibacter sp.]
WHGRLAVATAVAATFVVAAPANAADTVELDGGTTSLKLDGKTVRALRSAGITVAVNKPAKVSGMTARFPVSGGDIDPANAKGTIEHKGGLTLKMGRTKVALTSLTLNTGKKTFTAKSGKRTITVGTLAGGKVTRDGFATKVAGVKVKLGKAAAGALNRAFGGRVFKSGLALGTATLAPETDEIAFDRGTTTLTFNAQTAAGLRQLGVNVAPVAPATANATGGLVFPVTGGVVDTSNLSGRITHSGGLTLGTLALSDPVITLGSSVTLGVNLGTIADIALSGAPAIDPATRTVRVAGAVRLNEFAATALNQLFGRPIFAPGAEIATASLDAVAR